MADPLDQRPPSGVARCPEDEAQLAPELKHPAQGQPVTCGLIANERSPRTDRPARNRQPGQPWDKGAGSGISGPVALSGFSDALGGVTSLV